MFSMEPSVRKGTERKIRSGRRPKKPRQRQGAKQWGTPQQRQKSVRRHDGYQTKVGDGSQRHDTNSTIWRTLDEAKRKQDSIRKRVRKYGSNDDDSDYNDSPSSENNIPNHDFGDSDSDDYDDEFDLGMHEKNVDTQQLTEVQKVPEEQYSAIAQISCHDRTKSFNNSTRSHTGTFKEHPTKQTRPTKKGQIRVAPSNSLKPDGVPALTPEEAIRMVMERHSYVSDSEDSEHEKLARKIPERKSSSTHSTAETTANTTALYPDENLQESTRTHRVKRVLVFKNKKHREDTHPITSKNKKLHEKQPSQQQKQQPQPQHNSNIENPSTLPRNNQQQTKQQQEVHLLISTKEDQKQVVEDDENVVKTIQPLVPLHSEVTREENKRHIAEEEDINRQCLQLKEKDNANEVTSYHNSDRGKEGPSTNSITEATDPELMVADKKSQQRALVFDAVAKRGDITGKDNEHNGVSNEDDDDDDEYDYDLFGTDNSIAKQPAPGSSRMHIEHTDAVTEGFENHPHEQKDKIDDSCVDDEVQGKNNTEATNVIDLEEDWGRLSFQTAKTSKSVISRYSKTSSTALWMKAVEQGGSERDQDDDILFFDAIQCEGEYSNDISIEMSDDPSIIVADHSNTAQRARECEIDSEDNNSDREGWKKKITTFVGFTIGALASGSKDKDDYENENENENENEDDQDGKDEYDFDDDDDDEYEIDLFGAEPVSPPRTRASTKRAVAKSRSPKVNRLRSPPNDEKKVPSGELEIIRKCQEQMEHIVEDIELREREAARNSREDMELRRREEEDRAPIRREVMAYRKMMEGMGKSEKLAPLDSREAAQDYDDRLAMCKTLKEQERKNKMTELNLLRMDMEGQAMHGGQCQGCTCSCIIS